MKIILSKTLCVIISCVALLVFFGCNETEENSSKPPSEVDKPKTQEWVGTFNGVCPSYNMKNKYGEDLVLLGNYVSIPAVQHTIEIYDNNTCSIYLKSEEGNYSCHNVRYSVSSNSNNFSLTMKPESGSDCGGYDIILIKSDNIFNIEAGTAGQPRFILNKIN